MKEQYEIQAIAHIVTDFSSKFGIPRQSGLVEELEGKILFEPEYGTKEAVKGLEEFSHIWQSFYKLHHILFAMQVFQDL